MAPQTPHRPRNVWQTTLTLENLLRALLGSVQSPVLNHVDKLANPSQYALTRETILEERIKQLEIAIAELKLKPQHKFAGRLIPADVAVRGGDLMRMRNEIIDAGPSTPKHSKGKRPAKASPKKQPRSLKVTFVVDSSESSPTDSNSSAEESGDENTSDEDESTITDNDSPISQTSAVSEGDTIILNPVARRLWGTPLQFPNTTLVSTSPDLSTPSSTQSANELEPSLPSTLASSPITVQLNPSARTGIYQAESSSANLLSSTSAARSEESVSAPHTLQSPPRRVTRSGRAATSSSSSMSPHLPRDNRVPMLGGSKSRKSAPTLGTEKGIVPNSDRNDEEKAELGLYRRSKRVLKLRNV